MSAAANSTRKEGSNGQKANKYLLTRFLSRYLILHIMKFFFSVVYSNLICFSSYQLFFTTCSIFQERLSQVLGPTRRSYSFCETSRSRFGPWPSGNLWIWPTSIWISMSSLVAVLLWVAGLMLVQCYLSSPWSDQFFPVRSVFSSRPVHLPWVWVCSTTKGLCCKCGYYHNIKL
jgi:hypothetical protein